MDEIVDLRSALPRTLQGEEAIQTLLSIKDRFELDHLNYAGFNATDGGMCFYTTYPEAWQAYYRDHQLHVICPVVIEAQRSTGPVHWSDLKNHALYDAVFAAARSHGISECGVTIPVRGPYGDIGLVSVTSDIGTQAWGRFLESNLPQLYAECVKAHGMILSCWGALKLLQIPELSRRELEVLQWTAAGKTQQEIADILCISSRTVEAHLRKARDTMSAATTSQAVARAVALRLISL